VMLAILYVIFQLGEGSRHAAITSERDSIEERS
jgi:hypothetical protein